MSAIPRHEDRRLDLRLPLDCTAYVATAAGERIEARCIEIGVGGMTVHAAYVPHENEVLDVAVLGPDNSTAGVQPPLHGKLEVTRCHPLGDGRYEIGGRLVRVVK